MGQSSCAQLLMERTRTDEGSASEAISGERTRRTLHALSSQCLLSSREGNTHLNIEKQLAHVTESDQEPRMILKGRLKEKYSEGRYQRKTGKTSVKQMRASRGTSFLWPKSGSWKNMNSQNLFSPCDQSWPAQPISNQENKAHKPLRTS